MATTILDLFRTKQADIYTQRGSKEYIESRGLINAPRQAALILNSPTAIGDLIGTQAAGAIKGTANRPSDTIFPNKKTLSKSVSLIPGVITGVKDAVVENGDYYVKRHPSAPSVLGKIQQGSTSPKQIASRAAANAAKNPFEAARQVGKLLGIMRNNKKIEWYGPNKTENRNGKLILRPDDPDISDVAMNGITFTSHYPTYEQVTNKSTGKVEFKFNGAVSRGNDKLFYRGESKIDQNLYKIITDTFENDEAVNTFVKDRANLTPFVMFKTYQTDKKIMLPGTISGLAETISPEWSTFKYVGSPFNLYRYGGVERSISFNLKLYYTDPTMRDGMLRKLNQLRTLVFPSNDLAVVEYKDSNDTAIYGTLAIKPVLVYLTVWNMYKNILGIIDSLSISVPDEAPWASDYPTPTCIDVSFGFKIIEMPEINHEGILSETAKQRIKELEEEKQRRIRRYKNPNPDGGSEEYQISQMTTEDRNKIIDQIDTQINEDISKIKIDEQSKWGHQFGYGETENSYFTHGIPELEA